MSTTLFSIKAPHFTAGIEVATDLPESQRAESNRAAPIIHYMRTWSLDEIRRYCLSKGWEVSKVC